MIIQAHILLRTHVSKKSKLRFVIQRHKASHLHYDLRLEISGTLKSWALKKGPSMNPKDRRLAVMTTDHPLLYRFYRGIVPGPIWRGKTMIRLGARIVEIWDKGFYEPVNCPADVNVDDYMLQSLQAEKMEIIFHGRKLKGKFTLVKMNAENLTHYNADRSWLLIKKDDEYSTHEYYNSENLTSRFSLINRALRKNEKKKKNSRAKTHEEN
jgi:bifunctional non-homologous end joining protein LigD